MKLFKSLSLAILFFTALTLVSCSNYGKKEKSGHVEVYYKDDANKDAALKLAQYMENVDKQAGNALDKKSFQVLGGKGHYIVKMVAVKEKLKDVPDVTFSIMTSVLAQEVFGGDPTDIELTNNKFKTFKTYPYKKHDLNTLGGGGTTGGDDGTTGDDAPEPAPAPAPGDTLDQQ